MLLAAALRAHGLSSFVLEPDEIFTMRDSHSLNIQPSLNGPGIAGRPVSYLLQHAVWLVAPTTPFFLRLLPFCFGLIGIWLTWHIGRRLFGPVAGIIAAFLVAMSPWHMYASGMARYWSLTYVLSALALFLLLRAQETERTRDYLFAALALGLGGLTHPSFIFAGVGMAFGSLLSDASGPLRPRTLSRRELWGLWMPLILGGAIYFDLLKFLGIGAALYNWAGRGFLSNVRTVLGMVEWMTPSVAAAAAISLAILITSPRAELRRFGWVAFFGIASTVGLIFVSGFNTSVYPDYGMPMLPMIYLSIGAGIAQLAKRTPAGLAIASGAFAVALLTASSLPGIASNLMDGMRFDSRPSFSYIAHRVPERPVVLCCTSIVVSEYHAPGLPHTQMPRDGAAGLERLLHENGGFWFIAWYSRVGLQAEDRSVGPWLDAWCHSVQRTERQRFDFRVYRVELKWCGTLPPPQKTPQLTERPLATE